MEQREPSVSEPRQLPAEITDKAYIIALLQRLVGERLFVTVILPGSRERFTSTVLLVDPPGERFTLDRLFPEAGHGLIQQAGKARIFARAANAALRFDATLEALEDEGGFACYRMRFPATIHYLQRRDNYRVSAASGEPVAVTLRRRDGEVIDGVLHDISAGGVGILIEGDTDLEPGEVIPHFVAAIAEESLEVALEVRDVRYSPKSDLTTLGAHFRALDPKLEQRLRRTVAHLERERVRTRRHAR